MPAVAQAQQADTGGRTLNLSITAQVVTLLVLLAVFVGAIVITPMIWHPSEKRPGEGSRSEVEPDGRERGTRGS